MKKKSKENPIKAKSEKLIVMGERKGRTHENMWE